MLARALASCGRLLGLGKREEERSEDRRLWDRVACDLETTCQLAGPVSCDPFVARVGNISRGGINLLVARDIQPGDLVRVTLPAPEEQGFAEVLACVVRSEEAEGGTRELGCTFACELSEEELGRFGARKQAAEASDQRTWARFDCQARAVYRVVRSRAQGEECPAQVLNISASGVALQVDRPLVAGDLLSIEFRRHDDHSHVLTTLASIVRVSVGVDGTRLVGCNFIRHLAGEHIQALA